MKFMFRKNKRKNYETVNKTRTTTSNILGMMQSAFVLDISNQSKHLLGKHETVYMKYNLFIYGV